MGQWRECCCIARNIAVNGTPNHILVNNIMKYPMSHFQSYSKLVFDECVDRGYNVDANSFCKWIHDYYDDVPFDELFKYWHTDRYFWQCYYNLEEKFDCGAIPFDEWEVLCDEFIKWV